MGGNVGGRAEAVLEGDLEMSVVPLVLVCSLECWDSVSFGRPIPCHPGETCSVCSHTVPRSKIYEAMVAALVTNSQR